MVKDDLAGQVNGDGAKNGREGDVGGDRLCELDNRAHEEGRENLREEEGAVQDGKVQTDAALVASWLWLLLAAATGDVSGAVLAVSARVVLATVLVAEAFPKVTPWFVAVFAFLFHRSQKHRIPLGDAIFIDALAFLFWHEDLMRKKESKAWPEMALPLREKRKSASHLLLLVVVTG